MQSLTIDVNLANKIGLKQAVLIAYFNQNNDWQRITYQSISDQFQFLGKRDNVYTLIKKLEITGLLESDYRNQSTIDRTKSYRINYDKLREVIGQWQ